MNSKVYVGKLIQMSYFREQPYRTIVLGSSVGNFSGSYWRLKDLVDDVARLVRDGRMQFDTDLDRVPERMLHGSYGNGNIIPLPARSIARIRNRLSA